MPPVAAAVFDTDATFLAELHLQFLRRAPQLQAALRQGLQASANSPTDADRLSRLADLTGTVHNVAGFSGVAGRLRILHLASALEALLRELGRKPDLLNDSTRHTVDRAVGNLVALLGEAATGADELPRSALILAVDDEPVARLTIRSALAKTNLKVLTLDSPDLALKVLKENRFDLVFLDVNMPGMDGFELATRLHYLSTNAATPVVFVTSLPDYESAFRAATSSGDDVIAKPFLAIELAVKALTYIVQPKPSASGVAQACPTSCPP